jgi:hypothetical protein
MRDRLLGLGQARGDGAAHRGHGHDVDVARWRFGRGGGRGEERQHIGLADAAFGAGAGHAGKVDAVLDRDTAGERRGEGVFLSRRVDRAFQRGGGVAAQRQIDVLRGDAAVTTGGADRGRVDAGRFDLAAGDRADREVGGDYRR